MKFFFPLLIHIISDVCLFVCFFGDRWREEGGGGFCHLAAKVWECES